MSDRPQPVWLYGAVESCKNSIEAVVEDLQRISVLLAAVCTRLEEDKQRKEQSDG
jgi:hypothetical protein